jgi:hypothetical protein
VAFTFSTCTHKWQNADGTPCSGEVVFTLSEAITNGSVTIAPTHVTATLDPTGSISQSLASNLDVGTVPGPGAANSPFTTWRVDEKIFGAAERTYNVQVPSGGVAFDLSSVMPFQGPQEFA